MDFQLADLLEALCDADRDAEVLVAGERRFTRGALDERANRLAHHLAGRGVQRGDRVGVYACNRGEWVEALVACWKLGAAAINVNYRYVVDELRYLWDNATLTTLIYERGFAPQVRTLALDFPRLTRYLVLEDGSDEPEAPGVPYEDALASSSPERGFAPRSGDDRHVLYTGGTTGLPKGVVWRHEDLYRNLAWPLARIETPEQIVRQSPNPMGLRTLALAPLMHGGGQYPLIITVFNGGVSVLSTDRSFDAERVLDLVARERVMTLNVIGDAMGAPIADAALDPTYERDLSALRVVTSGGAILSEPVRARLRTAFPDAVVTGGVGASEIGTAAFEAGREEHDGPRFKLATDTAVLDDDLEPVPPGGVGRVARRGAIPVGYLGDPERTAATFPVDRHGIRWVIPGDYARVEPDGTFVLLGRGSACINSGGEKIYPDEVEHVVALHPAVHDVIVVGAADPTWQERVVALVDPEPGSELSLVALQAHCRRHLAGYKIPRALVLGPLRRTEIGKPDYRWATARAAEASGSPGR